MNKGKSKQAPADAASKSMATTEGAPTSAASTDSAPHASTSQSAPPQLIVGIGASAGGLEAFKTFFSHMPVDSEMAFVLVQHLAPDHISLLSELVGRSTTMPVIEATDGMQVEPRHVYVIPPNATLCIVDSVLQVVKPAPARQFRFPIDTFFKSLAEDQGDCAVCVVLSGSGSDGSRGLRAIKEHGGLTLAQAGIDHVAMSGMPAAAAATGLVDEVLPAEDMPEARGTAADDEFFNLCAVAFDDVDRRPPIAGAGDAAADAAAGDADNERIKTLEQEITTSREQLYSAIDQLETLNGEIKSTNEEYQSVNEELQSSNEELETSKEEMQSINEELHMVNTELNSQNEAMLHLNNDLQNLMDSTHIATLFLDAQLQIRSFTPPTTDVFNLREGDRGRPITDIASRLQYPDLQQDMREVLRTLVTRERELESAETGKTYVLRMMPYRTIDNRIDGVVLTFVDVTERKVHELECSRFAAIIASSKDAIIGHSLDGTIDSWNHGAEHLLGYSKAEMLSQSLLKVAPGEEQGQLRELLDTCRTASGSAESEMSWRHKDGSVIQIALTCSPVKDGSGRVVAGSTIARDISQQVRADAHKSLMHQELNHRVKNSLASVQAIALQTLSSAHTLADFKLAFMSRLMALSNTHNLLAEDAWSSVGLREIISSELAPYDHTGKGRADLAGGDVQLDPETALALAMAVHELATNAGKYGALSVPEGRIVVEWDTRSADGGTRLRLQWREHDGPPVVAPQRKGFGSRLITEGLTMQLDGEATLAFETTGLVCCIDIPLPAREEAA